MGIPIGPQIRDALPGIHCVRVSTTTCDSCVAHCGSAGASPSQSMQSIVPYSMSLPVFHDCAQCPNQLSILSYQNPSALFAAWREKPRQAGKPYLHAVEDRTSQHADFVGWSAIASLRRFDDRFDPVVSWRKIGGIQSESHRGGKFG